VDSLDEDDYPFTDISLPPVSANDVAWFVIALLGLVFIFLSFVIGAWDIISTVWSWLRG